MEHIISDILITSNIALHLAFNSFQHITYWILLNFICHRSTCRCLMNMDLILIPKESVKGFHSLVATSLYLLGAPNISLYEFDNTTNKLSLNIEFSRIFIIDMCKKMSKKCYKWTLHRIFMLSCSDSKL